MRIHQIHSSTARVESLVLGVILAECSMLEPVRVFRITSAIDYDYGKTLHTIEQICKVQ